MKKTVFILIVLIFSGTTYCYSQHNINSIDLSIRETKNLVNMVRNATDSVTLYTNCFDTNVEKTNYKTSYLVYIHAIERKKIVFTISSFPISIDPIKNISLIGYIETNNKLALIGIDSSMTLSSIPDLKTYRMHPTIDSVQREYDEYCKYNGIVVFSFYYVFEFKKKQLHRDKAYLDFCFYSRYIDIPRDKRGNLLKFTSKSQNFNYSEYIKDHPTIFSNCDNYYLFSAWQKERITSSSMIIRNPN